MGVAGDLSTMDLADLFQNIETHRRTGTLTIRGGQTESRIYFRDGQVAMLASDRRQDLGQMLVSAGLLTRRRLEGARKKGAGPKHTVADVLVARKAISQKRLREAAEDFLFEDVADLIAGAQGAFSFEDGDEIPSEFDRSEESLNLGIASGPLIMEAHRRADHWVLIHKFVPSRDMYFVARENAICPDDVEDRALGEQILNLLNGTRSVVELEAYFPTRRFLVNKLLADFVRDRLVRGVEADDLARIASQFAKEDVRRARAFVERGLEAEPHHLGLLRTQAELAETMGDATAAAGALKLLAHLQIESGKIEEATRDLDHAKKLTPTDPAIWERTLTLAMQQGLRELAVKEGMELVGFHRAPGLHGKAKEVLERLIKLDPESVELRIELAHTLVDMGESVEATRALLRWAKRLIGKQNYVAARVVFTEVLNIEPGNKESSISIEMIDKETYAQRRERKRRIMRMLLLALAGATLAALSWLEITAHMDYVRVVTSISKQGLIEHRRYGAARTLLERVQQDHPLSLTAHWDIRQRLDDLAARQKAIPTRAKSPEGR